MTVRELSRELEKRTRIFAIRIIRLSINLPNTPEGRVVKTQLTKAGTSIGANDREANRSGSKADFKIKSRFASLRPVKPNIGWS
jgi:four helix bundle protein